jgi:hypothetical protein
MRTEGGALAKGNESSAQKESEVSQRRKARMAWIGRGLAGSFIFVSLLVSFQNCSQDFTIQELSSQVGKAGNPDDLPEEVVPEYASVKMSLKQAPKLNLFFVVDNSMSMKLSNLNLKRSIGAMFDQQAKTISEFDTDLYFISTAQRWDLAQPFLSEAGPNFLTPPQVAGSAAPLTNYRSPSQSVSGLLAGDILGFRTEMEAAEGITVQKYLTQPVVSFSENQNGRSVIPAVTYKRGSSLIDLKAQVDERLDILAPERAASSENPRLFAPLDNESATCAVARVLRNPDEYMRRGDLASFILVSDEEDSDPTGAQCLGERRTEDLYSVTCEKRIPASTQNRVSFSYEKIPT